MSSGRATAVAAGLAAAGVILLLLPYSGHDTDPPECSSLLGDVVPRGSGPEQAHGVGFAVAGAVVAAALTLTGWAVGRAQAAGRGGEPAGDDRR